MWRIIWHQREGNVNRVRWHTGDEAEIRLLEKACMASNERYWVRAPGEFKR